MKGIVLLGLCMIAGCSYTPLEELEKQAMVTGDWSAVERRERLIAEREARTRSNCPSQTVEVCETFIGDERCSCVEQSDFSTMLFGR